MGVLLQTGQGGGGMSLATVSLLIWTDAWFDCRFTGSSTLSAQDAWLQSVHTDQPAVSSAHLRSPSDSDARCVLLTHGTEVKVVKHPHIVDKDHPDVRCKELPACARPVYVVELPPTVRAVARSTWCAVYG